MELEKSLSEAYVFIANQHNILNITKYIKPSIQNYYGRNYKVIFGDRFAQELFSSITDKQIIKLNKIGNIDQITNELQILQNPELIGKITVLY